MARHPGIVRDSLVWVSLVYADTQTLGLDIARHPGIVRDSLGISAVFGYSDTGVGLSQTSWDNSG